MYDLCFTSESCLFLVSPFKKLDVILQYLLQYIKSVTDWLEPEMSKYPLARTAWSILRDSYHTSTCLRYPPTHVAVTVLYMTLEIHGVEVPYNHQAEKQWWKVRLVINSLNVF